MAEKPAPKPEDDTYSDEEIAKRMDATVRAMIGMKPQPHKTAPKSRRVPKGDPENG
jgi:hypothetical protein